MIRIYEAANILEASILKGLLEQQGIESYVSGLYLQGGIGDIPVSGHNAIWVNDEQADTARTVIEAYEKATPDDRPDTDSFSFTP